MLDFEWNNQRFTDMQELFNDIIPDSLYMTHYELNKAFPKFTTQDWKEFLIEPRISDYISSELRLLQAAEMKKLMRDISKTDRAKSPGTAQILTTLSKNLETAKVKEGPVFIYMSVPLTEEEKRAPNVSIFKA